MDGEAIEILRGIWGEMKALNGRISGTNERLDALRTETNERLDALRNEMNERLDDHHGLLTEVVRVLGDHDRTLKQHGDALERLADGQDLLNERLENFMTGVHRQEHDEMRARIAKLEERVRT